jgi:hypothetical protein
VVFGWWEWAWRQAESVDCTRDAGRSFAFGWDDSLAMIFQENCVLLYSHSRMSSTLSVSGRFAAAPAGPVAMGLQIIWSRRQYQLAPRIPAFIRLKGSLMAENPLMVCDAFIFS